MDQRGVMDTVSVADAIAWQADHAARNGAPGTARIIRAMLALEEGSSVTARRILGWEGLSLRDAMPLRIAGGLHHLMLTGDAPQLERVYDGQLTDQADIDVLVGDLLKRFDARLLPWLGSPPQTNEAGRSASFMAALLWLADGRTTARFSLLEIGAIAGINTMMGRYRYRLGKTVVGPVQSAMHIAPEWRGASPPASAPCIADARGCDIAPVDLSDPDQALRLKAYIWPDAPERMARMDAAIALARETPPRIDKANAASWLETMFRQPQRPGITRAVMHSIMWQYMEDAEQARCVAAIEAAGDRAGRDSPLAWVALETNRQTFAHELRVRYWPGGEDETHLANAHPHGRWVKWLGG